MKTEKKYALITGASQGLGKEIAISLAKRNINMLLVASDWFIENKYLKSL